MKGELPFASPCVVGHEITGEVVDHGMHTPAEIVNRYIPMQLKTKDNTCLLLGFSLEHQHLLRLITRGASVRLNAWLLESCTKFTAQIHAGFPSDYLF